MTFTHSILIECDSPAEVEKLKAIADKYVYKKTGLLSTDAAMTHYDFLATPVAKKYVRVRKPTE